MKRRMPLFVSLAVLLGVFLGSAKAGTIDTTAASLAAAYTLGAQTFTAAQQDIWLDQLRQGDSPLYNIGGYVDFAGAVVPALIEQAVVQLVATHDALRSQLHGDADGLPQQTFVAEMAAEVALHDVSAQPDPVAAFQTLMQAQIARPYALAGEPLFRFFLVKLGSQHYRLGTQAHHLILDGWGFGQMLQSLADLYSALEQGRPVERLAPSYRDFIDADQSYRQSPRYARDRAYWLDKYQTLPEPLLTPRHTAKVPSNTWVQAFPLALLERMEQVAKGYQASAFHVLLAAMHVYFTRTSQREEWVVGVPILNRAFLKRLNLLLKRSVAFLMFLDRLLKLFDRLLKFLPFNIMLLLVLNARGLLFLQLTHRIRNILVQHLASRISIRSSLLRLFNLCFQRPCALLKHLVFRLQILEIAIRLS